MKVAQKPNIGRCREARIQSCASEIAMEAIAQAQRQLQFEREHTQYIVRTVREELNQDQRRALAVDELKRSEARINTLLSHIQELRALAGQYESLAA